MSGRWQVHLGCHSLQQMAIAGMAYGHSGHSGHVAIEWSMDVNSSAFAGSALDVPLPFTVVQSFLLPHLLSVTLWQCDQRIRSLTIASLSPPHQLSSSFSPS